VIGIGVGEDDVLQRDGGHAQVAQELPGEEVGHALAQHDVGGALAAIHQVPAVIGRAHQQTIALPHVNHVQFQQPLGGKVRRVDPARPAARPYQGRGFGIVQHLHRVAPEQPAFFARTIHERGGEFLIAGVHIQRHSGTSSVGIHGG